MTHWPLYLPDDEEGFRTAGMLIHLVFLLAISLYVMGQVAACALGKLQQLLDHRGNVRMTIFGI